MIKCRNGSHAMKGAKMKKYITTLTLLLCILTVFFAVSCKKCEHVYGEWEIINNSTCTENGEKSHSCTLCGNIESEVIVSSGHTYGEWEIINHSNCTENGEKSRTCTICNDIESEVIISSGHTYGAWREEKAPTTSANGYIGHYQCANCKEYFDKDKKPIDSITVYATGSVGLSFVLNQDGSSYALTGLGSCKDKEIYIPDKFNGMPVTAINNNAFLNGSKIKKIVIPDTVVSIGDSAFKNCYSIESITLPKNLINLGEQVFRDCSNLRSITIPDGVALIGNYTFAGCNKLVSIFISDNVNSIGKGAFYGCEALTSFKIPSKTTVINDDTFVLCKSLETVNLHSGITSIGKQAFMSCVSLKEIKIPSAVTEISDGMFLGCVALNKVELSTNIKVIGAKAFQNCTFQEISLPDTVEIIKEYAFSNCNNLKELKVPEKVKIIPSGMVAGCSNLEKIELPVGTTTIGVFTFGGCNSLTSINIPEGVTQIADSAFSSCSSLYSVTIPSTVTNIGDNAFGQCERIYEVYNLSDLNIVIGSDEHGRIGEYAKVIHTSADAESVLIREGDYLFAKLNNEYYLINYLGTDTELNLPALSNGESYHIGDYFLHLRTDIKKITMEDCVLSIGAHAFDYCRGLESIDFADTIKEIKQDAFASCMNLEFVVLPVDLEIISERSFDIYVKELVMFKNVKTVMSNAFGYSNGFGKVYFYGTSEEFELIDFHVFNGSILNSERYYYSESQPTDSGSYWHYVDGKVTLWTID